MAGHALNRAWPFYLIFQLEQKKGRGQLRVRPLLLVDALPWKAANSSLRGSLPLALGSL